MAKYTLEMLAEGFEFLEGPRWHDNRLWLSDMWGETVYTLTEAGERTAVAKLPQHPSGINFLPDGRMVVVSMQDRKLMATSPDSPGHRRRLTRAQQPAMRPWAALGSLRQWPAPDGAAPHRPRAPERGADAVRR